MTRGQAEGKDVSAYDRAKLMSAEYDETPSWRPKPTSASVPSSAMLQRAPGSSTT